MIKKNDLPATLRTIGAAPFLLIAVAAPAQVALHPLSSELHETALSTDSMARTAVFAARFGPYYRSAIVIATRQGSGWGEPVVAPFSGGAPYDVDPFLSADGNRIIFSSNRTDAGAVGDNHDLFETHRIAGGWSQPVRLASINSPAADLAPALDARGRLFFMSRRSGRGDIYMAEPDQRGGFATPVKLPDAINGEQSSELGVAISPSGMTMVIASSGRPDELLVSGTLYGRGDLYISRMTPNGWSTAEHLPAPINTRAAETNPLFSPDGVTLRFASERSFATDQQVTLTPEALREHFGTTQNGLADIYELKLGDGQ